MFLGLVQCAFLQLLGVSWVLDLLVGGRFGLCLVWSPEFGVLLWIGFLSFLLWY